MGDGHYPAALALGTLFDATNVQHSRLRRLAHEVLAFADSQLQLLALTRNAARSYLAMGRQ